MKNTITITTVETITINNKGEEFTSVENKSFKINLTKENRRIAKESFKAYVEKAKDNWHIDSSFEEAKFLSENL